jgi:hypothetical protein
VQEYLLALLGDLPEAPAPTEYEATLALFEQWAEEDASSTQADAEREDADWEEIDANLQANRLTFPVPEA